MGKAWNQTRVAEILGIEYPIIQGPLGGFSSQRLAAAVSNFGGLGSFGAHGFEPGAIGDMIAEIRSLTVKPFAMNLWVSMEDDGARTSDAAAFQRAASHLAPYISEVGGTQPNHSPYKPIRFEAQARILLDAKVPAFSFIYGIPPAEILEEAKRQGIVTLGTATTMDEATALEQAGVDIVVASGFEAGGHRGSFLQSSEDSLTGTMSLVPQTVDAISIPVVAAGGIADARGIIAALALGAEGVQMGTVFLATEDSGAHPLHREAILKGTARQTALTRGFTGRLARGIKNNLLGVMNQPGTEILPYPLQRALMRNLAIPAQKAGRADLLALWAGQSASLAHEIDVNELLKSLVTGVAARYENCAGEGSK
ncbi:NAD(P)H-dependent flavin oxidoreductase [Tunturibacter empetritectus]|uniref:Nitronate monooxygenase n=1 Tax=Tunturiibacter lichenicola TaxID=2051959 RepID=A0A7W8J8G4_9BACT|nr:nitronate monooxygenase [Edaphobacter lichenicola]MBB5343461.1 nitronate monooxygenase [Edaphobacter lichenicola]